MHLNSVPGGGWTELFIFIISRFDSIQFNDNNNNNINPSNSANAYYRQLSGTIGDMSCSQYAPTAWRKSIPSFDSR